MEFLFEGITLITWKHLVMYGVGIILIFLAVKKEYEPTLLLPMGFGFRGDTGKPALVRRSQPDSAGRRGSHGRYTVAI